VLGDSVPAAGNEAGGFRFAQVLTRVDHLIESHAHEGLGGVLDALRVLLTLILLLLSFLHPLFCIVNVPYLPKSTLDFVSRRNHAVQSSTRPFCSGSLTVIRNRPVHIVRNLANTSNKRLRLALFHGMESFILSSAMAQLPTTLNEGFPP
jgi:hypothetical protein